MPADFECRSCQLRFATGYHYFDLWPQGYTGRTNLFCSSCGTQHGLEPARADRGKPFNDVCRVTVHTITDASRGATRRYLQSFTQMSKPDAEAMLASLPVVLGETHTNGAEAIREKLEPLGAQVVIEIVGQTANPYFGPIQKHRLRFLSAPVVDDGVFPSRWLQGSDTIEIASIELPHLTCQHCGSAGSLRDEFNDKTDRCPSCQATNVICSQVYLVR